MNLRDIGTRSVAPWMIDVALILVALIEAASTAPAGDVWATALSFVAAAGLLLRHRAPWVSLLLALPGLFLGCATVAAVVALYSLAITDTRRRLLVLAAAVAFVVYLTVAYTSPAPAVHPMAAVISSLMFAVAPVALGSLVATRHRLTASLSALREAQEAERRRVADEAVARERATLSREMHDVVSHQVSLIAVQAGALQVRTNDPAVREASRAIRRLSVATLEELRTMVALLRGSGMSTTPDVMPQPVLTDVDRLVTESGLDVNLDLDLPCDLPLPVQRAIYRTIQECLTNARKHAPGAAVTIRATCSGEAVELHVTNSRPTRPPLPLPGSRLGLIGLSERAMMLDGSVTASATPDGGFETVLRAPAR